MTRTTLRSPHQRPGTYVMSSSSLLYLSREFPSEVGSEFLKIPIILGELVLTVYTCLLYLFDYEENPEHCS
ncbi:hypothetical protein M758_8G083500 [Ceratodon purpureus]|uniref:Uncharacterized protein n=1 Tax=Ceratodon purpureus TaxID=3225 RepID=A0A8T0H1C0_CERPU|nr:hypothetical protein KC19_8G087800 [Ceratodon purpureus]KAG0608158.1 hypothetical protein M758_8G083500 [Ceratodon purpureus]